MQRHLFCFSALIFFLSQTLEARFMAKEEAPYEETVVKIVTIHKDGTSSGERRSTFKPLAQEGVGALTSLSVSETSYMQKLRVEGETLKTDGNTVPAEKKHEEIGSSSSGFDSKKQWLLRYKNLELGDSINLETEFQEAPSYEGYYTDQINFSSYPILKAGSSYSYTSSIPLFFKLHDPRQLLEGKVELSHTEEDGVFKVELKILEDLTLRIISETHTGLFGRTRPLFWISTKKNHEDIIDKATIKAYWQVIKGNRPSEKIDSFLAKLRREKRNLIHDAASIISFMITELHISYFGDWKTRDGKLIPKPLETTITHKTGDCKDYASLMVRLLTELGYKASPTFVQRSNGYFSRMMEELAYLETNHAIVHVRYQDKDFYFDPTNKIAIAGNISSDIFNRPAYIMREDFTTRVAHIGFFQPTLEEESPENELIARRNTFSIEREIAFSYSKEGIPKFENADIKIHFEGAFSESFFKMLSPAYGVKTQQQRIDVCKQMLNSTVQILDIPTLRFDPRVETSLHVPPISTSQISVVTRSKCLNPNSRQLIYQLVPWFHSGLETAHFEHVENDFVLSLTPVNEVSYQIFKGLQCEEEKTIEDNQWWTISFEVRQHGPDVHVKRSYSPKVRVIPRHELIDPATGLMNPLFAEHLRKLQELNWRRALIFKRIIPPTKGGLEDGSMQAL